MARTKKQSVLKQLYFRSFIILVVIPLLVVFIGAFSIVSYLIRAASIETIDAFQESVALVLQTDVRTASLQLSHFVYVNDGEFPAMAAQVYDSGYASSTFTLYTIKTAFTFSNFGLASTMAVAIMVLIIVIYVIQNKIIHGVILKEDK